MALTYLVDTNTISELERLPPEPNVNAQLRVHWDQIALAAVSWHELLYGFYRLPDSKRKQRVEYFIKQTVEPTIPILPYTAAAAKWFAIERARLSRIGRPPSYPDGQIAAVAFTNNLTLVTRNTKDFAHFTDLRFENWFQEI